MRHLTAETLIAFIRTRNGSREFQSY